MFENKNRTEINQLGEKGLIKHLFNSYQLKNNNSFKGIEEDCGIIINNNNYQLIYSHNYCENIHFDLSYTPLPHLGYKSIVAAISHIVAKGGNASQVTVSVSLSNRFSLEAIEELYKGIFSACHTNKLDIISNQITSINQGLVINIGVYGEVSKEQIALSSGAIDNDLVLVTGDLGAAFMGLTILEREKRIFLEKPDFQPDLTGNDYLIQRQLKPEARKDIIDLFKQINIKPNSMTLINNGLAKSLYKLSENSQVGFTIYEDKLPIDPLTYQRSIDLGIDSTVACLNGGDDFELLFTIPQKDYDLVKGQLDFTIIGHCVPFTEGLHLISKGNNKYPIKDELKLKAE